LSVRRDEDAQERCDVMIAPLSMRKWGAPSLAAAGVLGTSVNHLAVGRPRAGGGTANGGRVW